MSSRPSPRARFVGLPIAGLLALAALAGCGQSAGPAPDPGSAPPSVSSSAAPPSAGDADLTIVAELPTGRTTWTLSCAPPGGSHPDPAKACAALAAAGETALPPVPKDRACTQVYGGPETATVTGTWRGKPVTSTFSRVNGCEIGRWKALEGLLPPAGQ